MRTARWVRWATCALAVSICVPALAGGRSKSLTECTAFDQADKGEDKVEFTIHNTCSIPVDCAISWRLVCAPDSRKRRSVHRGAAKLALDEGGMQSTQASASACGDDGWSIDTISWSCQPNKD
jgi:hypothetical protein